MSKEQLIVSTYLQLKDCLDNEDDYCKMQGLIDQMAAINAEKAFDMWYPLLNKNENVVERNVNRSRYFIRFTLNSLGKGLGYSKLDSMILEDQYLYNLLIKQYCASLSRFDYTHDIVMRLMADGQVDIADKIFSDSYSNGNRKDTWLQIIDGFMATIKFTRANPSQESLLLLSKWAAKVEGEKDRAKVISSMLSSGLDFDFSVFDEQETISEKKPSNPPTNDDVTDFQELLTKYPEAVNDRVKLKALLNDYYPEKKLYTNIMLMVFDEGLVPELKGMTNVNHLKVQRLTARLVNNYGISENLASIAIDAWIKGMN